MEEDGVDGFLLIKLGFQPRRKLGRDVEAYKGPRCRAPDCKKWSQGMYEYQSMVGRILWIA